MVASQFLYFLLSDVRNSFPAIKPEFESNYSAFTYVVVGETRA
jgi:hypothetical protein